MRWRWIAGIAVLGIAAGAAYIARHRASPAPAESYVDPALCAGCHENIWETYRRTGMGRSFYRPSSDTVKSGSFYHQASESYFTVSERDGRFYQRRYQTGYGAKETNSVEKQIDYVVGSGNHVQAYLHRTSRNTLIELPLAWYAEQGGSWGMNPGYDRPDHPGFTRTITNGCMFCHNGYPQAAPGNARSAEAVFPARLPEGIDCQRCHGPGSRHIQMAENGATAAQIRAAIVNPARLSLDRQMEVCMQCHLETTSAALPNAIVRYDRAPFSYRPGEPLADYMLQFDQAAGTGHDDKFEIAGAAYRLRRSACFLKSAGALQCTTCHNPHDIPRGEAATQHYTQVCRQCHDAAVRQMTSQGKHPASENCVACHMPKRRTDDAVHVVMTDHYIQRRKPERDLLAPLAERRDTEDNGYRGEVVPYYPREIPAGRDRDLYWAVAQVSQKSNLGQGIPALAAAIEKNRPEEIEFYIHLGDALSAAGQIDKSIPAYEEAARRKPDDVIVLRKWGFALRSIGQTERAAEVLKKAVQAAPADATSWHELGLTYIAQGNREQAVAAFEKASELDEDMAEPSNSLGAVWLEAKDFSRAEPAFREAIRRQPEYAEAHGNLASVLSATGRFEEARYHFEAALRLKPDYAAARYNYALALARVKRFAEAQRQLETELQTQPNAPEPHDLLGNLFAAQGKLPAAIQEFQTAVRLRPDFARAQLDLGSVLAASGNIAGALPYLQHAASSPDAAIRDEARQALDQIGVR